MTQPTTHPPTTYTRLRTTALAFIDAQSHTPHLPSRINLPALRALTTHSFTHTFGPQYSVSQTPQLQGRFDFQAFVGHLQGMLPRLERWEIAVKGVVVDEVGASVAVRAGYVMYVLGAGEGVENEVVWWLELERVEGGEVGEGSGGEGEGGGGWKVRKSTEIVDLGAAGRIRELMMRGGKGAEEVAE